MSPGRWLCMVVLLSGIACGTRRGGPDPREIDEATIAVLNTARALHHEADVFEAAGDYAAASRAVERVLGLRIPSGVEEADAIRADAWGRLGEIALAAGAPERALGYARTGLRESRGDSVMRARLYVVAGRALRALGDAAQTSGDARAAAARRSEAIESLETSIQINQRVLGRTRSGGTR